MTNTNTDTVWETRRGFANTPPTVAEGLSATVWLHDNGLLDVDLHKVTDLTVQATNHGHYATVGLRIRRPGVVDALATTYFDSVELARQALINLATSALKAAEAL